MSDELARIYYLKSDNTYQCVEMSVNLQGVMAEEYVKAQLDLAGPLILQQLADGIVVPWQVLSGDYVVSEADLAASETTTSSTQSVHEQPPVVNQKRRRTEVVYREIDDSDSDFEQPVRKRTATAAKKGIARAPVQPASVENVENSAVDDDASEEEEHVLVPIEWFIPAAFIKKEGGKDVKLQTSVSRRGVEGLDRGGGPSVDLPVALSSDEEEVVVSSSPRCCEIEDLASDVDSPKTLQRLKASKSGAVRLFNRVSWLNIGQNHPTYLAESTALATTDVPTIDDSLIVRVPLPVCHTGLLSNPQLETLVLAARALTRPWGNTTQGFFLGDGTGCGKGRVIAATILHCWNSGFRRHLWLTISSDLIQDVIRDLREVGAGHIPVLDLQNVPLGDLDAREMLTNCQNRVRKFNAHWSWRGEGVTFATYTLLSRSIGPSLEPEIEKFIFETYSPDAAPDAVSNVYAGKDPVKTRLGQILRWLKNAPQFEPKVPGEQLVRTACRGEGAWMRSYWQYLPDAVSAGGLICFDEAHKAKNISGDMTYVAKQLKKRKDGVSSPTFTATAAAVLILQSLLPHCKVLYASATGAGEIKHMAYMTRLGLWGPSRAFSSFDRMCDSLQKGGVAALECLAMDLRSRGLYSSRTLSFDQVEFRISTVSATAPFVDLWDRVASSLAAILADANRPSPNKFWSSQQRLCKQLLVWFKAHAAVQLARHHLAAGRQVVISLWGTGEAALTLTKSKDSGGESGIGNACEGYFSPPMVILEALVEQCSSATKEYVTTCFGSMSLPENPLDFIIRELGGPSAVAELSGRTTRLVGFAGGGLRSEARDVGVADTLPCLRDLARRGLTSINLQEQALFQHGIKKVAVITEAASTGISLHADTRLPNAVPRTMIVVELPWAADKAVQQFGRVHRCNQVAPPQYHILLTDIGGELRFVAAINRRLQTLGALTRGDRHIALGVTSTTQSDAGGGAPLAAETAPVVEEVQRNGQSTAGAPPAGELDALDRRHAIKDEKNAFLQSDQQYDDAESISFEKEAEDGGTGLAADIYSAYGTEGLRRTQLWLRASVSQPYPIDPGLQSLPSIEKGYFRNFPEFASEVLRRMNSMGIPGFDLHVSVSRQSTRSQVSHMDRLLNRVLMLPVHLQNDFLRVLTHFHQQAVEEARVNDTYDAGLERLGQVGGLSYAIDVEEERSVWEDPESGAMTRYCKLRVDHGVPWRKAVHRLCHVRNGQSARQGVTIRQVHRWAKGENLKALAELDPCEGFYWSPRTVTKRGAAGTSHEDHLVVLALREMGPTGRCILIPPAGTVQRAVGSRLASFNYIKAHGYARVWGVDMDHARRIWVEQYTKLADMCIHRFIYGRCERSGGSTEKCTVGTRFATEHLIVNNVTTLWSTMEQWMKSEAAPAAEREENGESNINVFGIDRRPFGGMTGLSKAEGGKTPKVKNSRLRIARVVTVDGRELVGAIIPKDKVHVVLNQCVTGVGGDALVRAATTLLDANVYFCLLSALAGMLHPQAMQGAIPLHTAVDNLYVSLQNAPDFATVERLNAFVAIFSSTSVEGLVRFIKYLGGARLQAVVDVQLPPQQHVRGHLLEALRNSPLYVDRIQYASFLQTPYYTTHLFRFLQAPETPFNVATVPQDVFADAQHWLPVFN